jgi:hypothetical protein
VTVEIIAIVLTLVVHVFGAGILIWALLDGNVDWRELWPRDDDDGLGGRDEPLADGPDGGGVLAPTPLPDAAPSPVRLREPGRIGERYPRPTRRPEHTPEHAPQRVPERS